MLLLIKLLTLLAIIQYASALKTYLIVGLSGVGKSTIANCIINKNPDLFYIRSYPFNTSNSASGCTRNFQVSYDNHIKVIDTVGFGDPELNQTSVLQSLRIALATENYQIDAILFVIRQGRLRNETFQFFKLMQNEVFRGKGKQNSILICNGCQKGWLEMQRNKNPYVDRALLNCNNLSYEFQLVFEEPNISLSSYIPDNGIDLELVLKHSYTVLRNDSIFELAEYLEDNKFSKLDLSFIAAPEYEKEFSSSSVKISRMIGRGLYVTGASAFGLGVVGISISPVGGLLYGMETLGTLGGFGLGSAGIGIAISHLIRLIKMSKTGLGKDIAEGFMEGFDGQFDLIFDKFSFLLVLICWFNLRFG